MVTAYFVIAGMGVILWIPILLKFYRSWVNRSNPISLAICAAIILLVWSSIAGAWMVAGTVNRHLVALVTSGMSTLVAGYCHLAFHMSSKKFPDQRSEKKE